MEQTTSNNTETKNKLSILIAQDGFSFCAGNKETNSIEEFSHKSFLSEQTPENLLKEIKTALQFSFFNKNKQIDIVEVIYSNTLYTVVPNSFFSEENITDYLKFNTKILATDYVTFDDVEAISAKNVYIPYTNINNYLFEIFGEFSFKHISSALINSAKKNTSQTKVLLYVHPTHFHIIAFKEGKLQLANSFNHQTKEDFIYYILFVLEQLELDPLETPVDVCGEIKEGDYNYNILSTYIKHIHFFGLDISNVSFTENLSVDTQKHNLLINQF